MITSVIWASDKCIMFSSALLLKLIEINNESHEDRFQMNIFVSHESFSKYATHPFVENLVSLMTYILFFTEKETETYVDNKRTN